MPGGMLLGVDAAVAASGGTLILDQFTDADGTLLTAHTIGPTNVPATSWLAAVSNFKVSSNKAIRNASGECVDDCDSGQADVTVSCDVVVQAGGASGGNPGALARFQDSNNYWMFRVNAATNQAELYQKLGGTFTLKAQGAFTVSTGTTYTLSLVCSGTSLTGYVNGVQYATFTSSSLQSATKVGFRESSTAVLSSTFDNFTVTHP